MGLYGTFRLTFGTRDFKYIIGTVPLESGRVVTLSFSHVILMIIVTNVFVMCYLQIHSPVDQRAGMAEETSSPTHLEQHNKCEKP